VINVVWFFLLIFGIGFGIITGKGEVVSKAILDSTESSVKLIIGFIGMMCLWGGVMKIGQESGMVEKFSKLLNPILKLLFKDGQKNKDAMGSMILNISSNMLGLSNAATPFGIKTMEELQKLNTKKDTATNDMALFLVLNATCIQLIPTSIISMRVACGSNNPAVIIIPAILATGIAAIMGIIYCKILEKFF